MKSLIFPCVMIALVSSVTMSACKKKEGCTDPLAKNYDPDAKKDDGTCLYPITERLSCDYFKEDRILKDLGSDVDYVVDCKATVSGNITVEPGVVIEFESDAGLQVDGGSVKAVGTAAMPVIFRGVSKTAGSWKGLYFETNDVNNQLEYVTVQHAGGGSFNSNNDLGSVILYAGAKLSIKNSRIEKGKAYGLNNNYNSAQLTFSNNVITETETPVLIMANIASALDAASQFGGNTNNHIYVRTEHITNAQTWKKLTVPYRVVKKNTATNYIQVKTGGSFRLEPGVVLLADSDIGIWADEGSFSAGTAGAEKVTISGFNPQPGAWRGIRIDTDDVNNVIDNVEIAHAGSSSMGNGHFATILLWSNSRATVKNSTLRDSAPVASCAINAPFTGETLITSGNTVVNIATEECQ